MDFSIRKRGFKSEENPYGWQFEILTYCDEEQLNELEQFYIMKYLKQGKQTYNRTLGSQGKGKISTDERKLPKGYYDGKKQGARDLLIKLQTPLKYVVIAPKDDKKMSLRMFERFMELITLKDEENNDDDEN